MAKLGEELKAKLLQAKQERDQSHAAVMSAMTQAEAKLLEEVKASLLDLLSAEAVSKVFDLQLENNDVGQSALLELAQGAVEWQLVLSPRKKVATGLTVPNGWFGHLGRAWSSAEVEARKRELRVDGIGLELTTDISKPARLVLKLL